MPSIPGLAVPDDFYWVLQRPVHWLACPIPRHARRGQTSPPLASAMSSVWRGDGPAYDPSPLIISHRTNLQDLYGGGWPRHPEEEEKLIAEAALAVVRTSRQVTGWSSTAPAGRDARAR